MAIFALIDYLSYLSSNVKDHVQATLPEGCSVLNTGCGDEHGQLFPLAAVAVSLGEKGFREGIFVPFSFSEGELG
jgi:hypothetical protein